MCSLTRNLCLCPNTVSVNLSSKWTKCKAEALHLPMGSPLTAKHQLRLSSLQEDLIHTGMRLSVKNLYDQYKMLLGILLVLLSVT